VAPLLLMAWPRPAAAGDPRALETAMKRFRDADRECIEIADENLPPEPCWKRLQEKRYDQRRARYRNRRREALNAIWHLAPLSTDHRLDVELYGFVKEIADDDLDPEIRELAARVLDRVKDPKRSGDKSGKEKSTAIASNEPGRPDTPAGPPAPATAIAGEEPAPASGCTATGGERGTAAAPFMVPALLLLRRAVRARSRISG
jgi:hypothetical protein